jgi:hypothetical protein
MNTTSTNNNTTTISSSTAGIGMAALGLSVFFGLLCAIAWICLMVRRPAEPIRVRIRRKDTQKERLVQNVVDSEQQQQNQSTNPFSIDDEHLEFSTIDLNTFKISSSDPVLDKPRPTNDEEIVQSELDEKSIVPNKLS